MKEKSGHIGVIIMLSLLLVVLVLVLVLLGVMIVTQYTNKENGRNNTLSLNNSKESTLNLNLENNSKLENTEELVLDYKDASSFENAVNSGKTVNGKTVKFDVVDYKPNSALGINCWAGEHLNFISDNELDVKKGDTIIGRVKEEPEKFLGSWKIKYDVIKIQENVSNENVENQNENTNSIADNKTVENNETQEQRPEVQATSTPKPEPTKEPESKEDEYSNAKSSAIAKRAFENMGNSLYPYGIKYHWMTGTIAYDYEGNGIWYLRVRVTITNQYGAERKAIAEGVVDFIEERVSDFRVIDE